MNMRQTPFLLFMFALSLGAPSAAVHAQVVGPNVNVSNSNGPQGEVGIAVNPTNSLNLVAVANNNVSSNIQLGVWYSIDGGMNWTPNFIDDDVDGFSATDRRFDPNVAFDSDGNVYVVYSTLGTGNRVLLARSIDGGQNFDQVTTVTTDAPTANNLHTAMVTTRSDGGLATPDDVLVVWARVQAGGESIEAALSLDAGATFPTTNTNINDALQRTFLPWAAVDGNGDFHVVWEVNQGGGAGAIFHDTLDGTTLASGADTQVTTVQITDFAAATSKIPAQPDRGLFSVSTIDVNRTTGRLFLSYTDRPNTGSNDTDIYVRTSDNGGANWSARTLINDDGTTTSQFMPRLAIDQVTGFAGVVWYDARNDAANNQQVDVYVSFSTDNGNSWSANQQVTTARSDESTANVFRNGNNYGEYFGLIAGDGVAHASWTDARAANFNGGTNEDVYTAAIYVDVPPICDAGGPYIAQCAGPAISLDGSGSSDPDGGPLTFLWSGPFTGSPVGGQSPAVSFPPPPGVKMVDLTVTDDEGDTAMCKAPVTVVDTIAPDFELSVSPTVLWPPNHKLVTINAEITMLTDSCDSQPTISLVSITSNEADNGKGDGDTADDIQGADFGTDDRTFSLRAERSGKGSSRTYTITYMAVDDSGNQTFKEAVVTVPKSRPTN